MTDSLARTVPATGAVERTTRRVVEGGCGASLGVLLAVVGLDRAEEVA